MNCRLPEPPPPDGSDESELQPSNNEKGNIEFNVPLIESKNKNKNDLIFFLLLITYVLFFKFNINKNEKK